MPTTSQLVQADASLIKDQSSDSGYERKWWVMAGAGLAVFVTSLNLSIINMSLPAIQSGLKTSLAAAEWVVLDYSLVMAVLLVSVGRLSDIFGRKRLFISGSVLFGVSSVLCGSAGHIYLLVLSRVLQGIGGALIVANGTAIVTDAFPPRELGRAIGILSSITAIGTTLGPSLGGFILARAEWPVIFFASAPVVFLGAILSAFSLRERKILVTQRFDWTGAIVLGGFLLTGLLGVTYGQDSGWGSVNVLALFVTSIAFGLLFLRVEASTSQPILDTRLLRQRVIAAAFLSGFLYYVATTANTFLSPFLLQRLFNFGAENAGMILMSVPLGIVIVAPLSGWLAGGMDPRVLASLGLAVGGTGFFWMSRQSPTAASAGIVPPYILLSIGGGFFYPPIRVC
ncbi:MAG: MFS transporter [Chloroflexi bacterium]|nr:MFS transporter [Chloroflexota bacterium]